MASIRNITFACEEPTVLAKFWAAALDYEIEELPRAFTDELESEGHDPSDACGISDPTGEGTRLFFKRMPKSPTEHIPIHLDLDVEDREAAVDDFDRFGRAGGGDENV